MSRNLSDDLMAQARFTTMTAQTGNNSALCPDLLRYEQIGVADNMRGRVVRAFFWIMRVWPTNASSYVGYEATPPR